ncbi:unnamed protein product [Schistocephalus solidus]|uniref:Uncharacterized protein n=1 Tax=Schistocephalus solidus TaxID=70667 RepID=A0A183SJS2_SCHSO|nr:unnamed protein product [Schistocephalus solidus]
MPRRPRSPKPSFLLDPLRRSKRRTTCPNTTTSVATSDYLPPATSNNTTTAPSTSDVSPPSSDLLHIVMTPGLGGEASAIAAAQGYYHLKLIHAQVNVPTPPFCGAYGGLRRSNHRITGYLHINGLMLRQTCTVSTTRDPLSVILLQ